MTKNLKMQTQDKPAIARLSPRRIGIIGGSGLYQIESLTGQKWVKMNTPFGLPSDELLTGEIAGREVVFLPRHGRSHHLLPSELNHRANIWAMKKLDVAWIISVSAVGSLQSQYRPRDIVFVNQFVDRTKKSAEHTFFGRGIVAHVAFAHPICEELRQTLMRSAREAKAHLHDGGTYVNMEGPAFSTQAESILNHQAGHAVIGMTNLGEARCAREAEIAYATMAMVTDYDAWKPDEAHVTVDLVIENLRHNAEQAKAILTHAILHIEREETCSCHESLSQAILTPPHAWPKPVESELAPLLKPVLARQRNNGVQ